MNEFRYTVVRSDRKSIALVIDSEANLIVRAPRFAKDSEIADFVKKKKRWILDKQYQVSIFGEMHSHIVLKNGESILYLGNTYTILMEAVPDITISSTNILIPGDFTIFKLVAWLKSEAEKVINERVAKYASTMGITYTSVRLSEAKARWGSCGLKANLNFAWRLIMCPLAVMDYVVVHELSHITYRNHSAGFWARVKTVLPNYKEHQDWLRINRKLMEII